MNENYDISVIETELQGILRQLGVSDKVYCNRPQAVVDSASDFVVVKVTSSLDDLATYGKFSFSVSLFAKDLQNIKNNKKLSVMYQRMVAGFPTSTNSLLITSKPRVLGDAPDDFGFHARVIVFNNVIIKAI